MTHKERAEVREAMKAYKAEGHTMAEVADKFGYTKGYVQMICKGIAPQQSQPEVYRNQYTNGKFDREANAIRYINERTPNFEYAGNFTGIDGYVDLKCKRCGAIVRKSFVTVKHGNATCTECVKREAQKRREADKIEREKQKQAKREARERDKWMHMQYVQTTICKCKQCGDYFIPYSSRHVYCSDVCAKKMNNTVGSDRRVKKLRRAMVDRDITLERLYKRDKGKCYICGCICDWNDCYTREDGTFIANDNYPSIDHVKPLSKGGKHSWSNVRLACRGCNSKKSDNIPSLVENGCT